MELVDSASRVSVGFPVSLALLFASILIICGLFCCCLHWDKVQYLLPSFLIINTNMLADSTSSHQKPEFPFVVMKQSQVESLPVLMPGDEVPKFIAMACPCQPPRDERITIQVQKAAPSDCCTGA